MFRTKSLKLNLKHIIKSWRIEINPEPFDCQPINICRATVFLFSNTFIAYPETNTKCIVSTAVWIVIPTHHLQSTAFGVWRKFKKENPRRKRIAVFKCIHYYNTLSRCSLVSNLDSAAVCLLPRMTVTTAEYYCIIIWYRNDGTCSYYSPNPGTIR